MMVLISVIIPVYNREKELIRAITSVLNQSIQDFEILVVDDFSEIDLRKVCADFNDSRIRYHRLEKKGNGNVCRNYGIKQAVGKFIAMLDSDDEWLNNHLELKIIKITEFNADGLFGSLIIDNGEEKNCVISRRLNHGEKFINYLLSDGSAQTSTYFFIAGCAKAVLWDETLLRHQDYDFSIRFSEKYIFIPTAELTCIVHWKKGEERTLSVESQIKFIEKNKKQILPIIYNTYYKNLFLRIINQNNISNNIKSVTQKNSVYYIKFCSFSDYITTVGYNKNSMSRFFERFVFVFKVLFSK